MFQSFTPLLTKTQPYIQKSPLSFLSLHLFPTATFLITKQQWNQISLKFSKSRKKSPKSQNPIKIASKTTIFHEELSDELFHCLSKGNNSLIQNGFDRFCEEIDEKIDPQRIFYFCSNGNEFNIERDFFYKLLQKMIKAFNKCVKSSKNIVIEYLLCQNEPCDTSFFKDLIKIVNNFKNCGSAESILELFFDGHQEKIEKKNFLKKLEKIKDFPVLSLMEFIGIELKILKIIEKSKMSLLFDEADKIKKKKVLKQIRKILDKCEYNGDSKCNCSNCRIIRKNRETANLSQKRKRDEIEQYHELMTDYSKLDEINKKLVKENESLKSENQNLRKGLEISNPFRKLLLGVIAMQN